MEAGKGLGFRIGFGLVLGMLFRPGIGLGGCFRATGIFGGSMAACLVGRFLLLMPAGRLRGVLWGFGGVLGGGVFFGLVQLLKA